ncbi:CBN-CNP-3 protein [Caenorhabditis brenneri]|uniref:CBN-CNP-3 protein n=1 Tax=Caenorhabditis brenneri TaxID=135651 RepID=G0MIH9_CAEBE|nr:CBN-CNP-3 protein [Caenorhabditis brenneri]
MASIEDKLEIQTESRERSCSSGSIISVSPDLPREPKLYSSMDFETLIEAIESIDISVFDRARLFHPRKQRSCHKRAEPVSEEHRKMESSKNSREYTKRNRDEISACRASFKELNEVRGRLEDLLKEYKVENVGMKVKGSVTGFEKTLRKYLNVGVNMKQKFNLPELDPFVLEYREKAAQVMQYVHEPTSVNVYATKLVELKQQFETLTSDKDTLNSSKDKTNFASSKSRLNQRIVREHLKSNCWECWKDIKTFTFRGQELKKLLNQLKRQVWDNILGVYYKLFSLFYQQKSPFDVQQIEEIVEYFTPFSRSPGRLLIKWTPIEKLTPEVVTLDDDDDNVDTLIKPKLTALPPTAETKQDREPPLERPQSMNLPKMLNPMIQDRLITTTQFTPPALPSPSFTLALPTVPASSVMFLKSPCLPTQNDVKTEVPAQNSSVPSSSNALKQERGINNSGITIKVEKTEISDHEEIEIQMNRKRTAPSSSDETEIKRKSIEDLQTALIEPKPDMNQTLNTLPAVAQPIGVQPIYSIPFNPAAIGTIPFAYNPLLVAPPAEAAPMQALTPNFLRAMEQQRVMAAFLHQAFQRCQK